MSAGTQCQFCGEPLDFGQEFVFLVEVQMFTDRQAGQGTPLAARGPDTEPLRTCTECRISIEENRQDRTLEQGGKNGRTIGQDYWTVLIMSLPLLLVALIDLIRRMGR